MSHLIQIKQKIKTVETISKVTHAMRLIAMSTHAKLKQSIHLSNEYDEILSRLFKQARMDNPIWHHSLLNRTNKSKELFIIIGAQKGLCGSFTNIITQKTLKALTESVDHSIITIGKQIYTVLSINHGIVPLLTFNQLSKDNYREIAENIVHYLWKSSHLYHTITVICMKSKGFFIQMPIKIDLINAIITKKDISDPLDYSYENDHNQTINALFEQALIAFVTKLLHNSLIAEQAARFLSMDNSTRNAKKILESTRLYYNKLRQTKITTQLMELITVTSNR